MKRINVVMLLALAAVLSAAGCVFGWRKKDAPETRPSRAQPATPVESGLQVEQASAQTKTAVETAAERDMRVQPVWQSRMLEELRQKSDKYNEAWGLFSEGGWSDTGQILIFANADRSQTRLVTSAPNKREINRDRALTSAEWQAIESQIKTFATLADVNETMFDGIVYEFVYARLEDGQSKVAKRLFIKQTGSKPHPEHDALIQALQALQK